MTESSFRLTFSSTNLRPRVAITLKLTASRPDETFHACSKPQRGGDAVERNVRRRLDIHNSKSTFFVLPNTFDDERLILGQSDIGPEPGFNRDLSRDRIRLA
jgi:hypothetical protein